MSAKVFHSELWGKRERKYTQLLRTDVATTPWASLTPQSPLYLFVPRDLDLASEYEVNRAVNDIFPLSSVGIVTARDSLTIHWTSEDVWKTVTDFAALDPEDGRAKYNLGKDVQDWKVELAQADVRSSGPCKDKIVPILYRPFDIRFTYYTGEARGFVCRPREDVMTHMINRENHSLVLPRKVELPGGWAHVLVSSHVVEHVAVSLKTIDYTFPVYTYPVLEQKGQVRYDGGARQWPAGQDGRRPNLKPDFISDIEKRLGLKFTPDGRGNLGSPVPQGRVASEDSRPAASGRTAAVSAAVSGASRPRFGEVTIRDRGRLPHWEAEGAVYFVTFRLADSLPRALLDTYASERNDIIATAKNLGRELSAHERKRLAELFSERIESALDKGSGACHLSNPDMAATVAEALRHFDGQRYRLFAWCVMPNHVHVVFKPLVNHALADIVHAWKSYTAKQANSALGREGSFWQREYHDHLIRDEAEFHRIVEYVAENPGEAGLQDWKWVWVWGQDAPTTASETLAVQEQSSPAASACTAAVPAAVSGASRPRQSQHQEEPGGPVDERQPCGTFGPEDVFHYIYAIFHSPTYRERYAEFLKRDFPRVPLTGNLKLFRELCHRGADLVALHLIEGDYPAASWNRAQPKGASPFDTLLTRIPIKADDVVENVFYVAPGESEPGTGRPLPAGAGRVYISRDKPGEGKKGQYFEGVPPEVWEFHVGGYQVCEKWLKDRKGRPLSHRDIRHYHKIVIALNETIRLMAEIHQLIDAHSGWPIR